LLFAPVALLMGLPGADGNAGMTYDVIERLARSFTYEISRTPGQPFLDYCNFVFWRLGGDLAVQAWFALVSALGIAALYQFLRDLRGASPLAGALALALHPLFLGHVGGVGDFAVSLSFVVVALWAANRGKPIVAGVALAMATGCRLVLCLHVIAAGILLWAALRRGGAARKEAARETARFAAVAAGVSVLLYAPLFAFYGPGLLKNMPFQTLRYHASAFAYRLLVALGAFFWVVVAALAIRRFRRLRERRWRGSPGAPLAALMLILCCSVTLFRVPTKPELALPILLGTIILFHVCASRAWCYALAVCSVLVGVTVPSPYDNQTDVYGWRFGKGWYALELKEACDNRLQINTVVRALESLPAGTVFVTRSAWTAEQARVAGLQTFTDYQGISGLRVSALAGEGGDRVEVHFQEPGLRELLRRIKDHSAGNLRSAVYDEAYLGGLRRWSHLDLAAYGKPIALPVAPLEELRRHAGQSTLAVVDVRKDRER
jgi:hypothetical protein